jgi:DNA-binding transcriptional regulator YbjK
VNETKSFALLGDLAQLVKKHGPTAFSDLASLLRSPEMIAELTTILETAEATGRGAKVTRKASVAIRGEGSRASVIDLLSQIEKRDPEKAQLLSNFYEAVVSKGVLPTLRELRSFARDNGLRSIVSTSRDKAVGPFIRDLATHPLDDIRPMLRRAKQSEDAPGDRSLEGWTDIILDKQRSRQ